MKDASGSHWSISLLLLLIAADLCFISLEILHSWGYAGDPKFSLGAERGYAEVYQYVKFFWIASILSLFTFKKREGLYFIGALLFFYFLLDDSLEIHETVGGSIVDLLDIQPAFGLRGQDYGELGVSALAGILFLVAGWLAYRYSGSLARRIGLYLLASVFALAIFGVGADMAHQLLGSRFPWTETALVVLEDGGELVVVSAICWFVYSSAEQQLPSLKVHSPIQPHHRIASRQTGKEA
ncbi:MAG: hypothetical protein GVY15_05015 [Bacteroidetes bacterium]|jgi:hypothetical protein|nr:hypothetical protein [Bacteroidota bacterium]